jgi:predicted membrane metal-binding protein
MGEQRMLKIIAAILVVLWLVGFLAHVGSGLIHLLLLIALAVFIYDVVVGRRHI